MLLQLSDWQFDINLPLTMDISAAQAAEHCSCGYCRNYYMSLDNAYPSIRPFLQRFGIDIEGPDELCPYEPTIYEATYIIQGHILQKGSNNLVIDNIPLRFYAPDEMDLHTEHPHPYFMLNIGLMELPWSLTEPMDQVISPANEIEFLERMQQKLLVRFNDDLISS